MVSPNFGLMRLGQWRADIQPAGRARPALLCCLALIIRLVATLGAALCAGQMQFELFLVQTVRLEYI